MGNKNRKKLLCHGLVLALVCSTAAGATVSDAAKKKAKLAKKSLTIPKGASKKIKIKYKKKKAKYKFKASNKKVKVYKSGKVKALKVGKAKVTVKEVYKKKTRSLGKVTVKVTKKRVANPEMTIRHSRRPTPIRRMLHLRRQPAEPVAIITPPFRPLRLQPRQLLRRRRSRQRRLFTKTISKMEIRTASPDGAAP